MTNNNAIGLFDSGIGGTSIWREIRQLLPSEDTIYLADSKNAPYGLKSQDEIIALSIKNTELLLSHNCKLIVVACNTATTNAIQELRHRYDVPFVGIEPAIKPAAHSSKTQNVGILATKGTLSSALFSTALQSYGNTKFIEQIGHGLVELIESGKLESPEMTALLHQYLEPMVAAGIDHLVLGCSHYPYLIPQIRKLLPAHIEIIDSGEAVAKQTQRLLLEKVGMHESGNGHSAFFTNIDPSVLNDILGRKYLVQQRNF